MQRIPEPELMNQPEQVEAYSNADFEAAHESVIELFAQKFPGYTGKDSHVLDLGCGPGDISRRFARRWPGCYILAVDAADNMLIEAERLNEQASLTQRIELQPGNIHNLALVDTQFDTIISNSLLHHLHEPNSLWRAINTYATTGTQIFIMDLLRPENAQQVDTLVNEHTAGEPDILREDFRNSLFAAFTLDEVNAQLQQAGLDYLKTKQVSDRHMIIYGTCP